MSAGEAGGEAESIALELAEDDVDAGDGPDVGDVDQDGAVDGDQEADVDPDQDADVGGGSSKPFSKEELKDRMMSTEPNLPLGDPSLDDVVDAENGGLPRIKRGLYKALGLEGATALEDFVRGGVEVLQQRRDGESRSGDGDGEGTDDGNDDGGADEAGGFDDGVPDV